MSALPDLSAIDQRILGSLLEKQVTVPASYPLSLNSLKTACNQTSSRDPVVEYDDHMLELGLKSLRERGLVRVVWSDTGRRTLKYHQLLDEQLGLEEAERAILTVLLLRGPNAPGELKTRTERLHTFGDRAEVEVWLRAMSAREPALVRELERRPGQQDSRWIHLLGDQPVDSGPVAAAAVDLDAVLADGAEARDARVLATYGAVAEAYADRISDELDELPFERWLLGRVAASAPGPIADVGCGPGHVTAFLAEFGADVTGFDVTPEMVAQARARHPELTFEVADLRRLLKPRTADGWGAVLAWYSLIHLAPSELGPAVAALARTLHPGGLLVLALHAGPELRRRDTWWDYEGLELDFVLPDPEQVVAAVSAAGLVDVEWYLRSPLPAREETTRRFYLIAQSPS
jgi:uncharacterized protein YceH (UPF0502 family)